MANEAGVVKSITGGSVRALNNATGEVRNLSVGDIVYQNEKIITDSSDSKVTITQTDGKEITLIGKDTITLDQDTNNNQTVADISALQQAILKGTDLNALEETAAGGPQAGGNGGDGVSLSSTSFAEGGHISNINANVGSIDALALAAGGDNSFGVSGGSAVGAGAGTGATTPKVGINISSAGSNEGEVMTYDLSLPTALTARPTTLNLNFSGGVAGVDYDANSIEYSTDGGNNWIRGTIVNLTDANQINNVKVRVTTIDNYGLKDVDLANNPTAMGVNQNQGEQDGSKYSNLNGVEYGVYKRNLTLNVTTDNDEIANSQANGKITDNDDYVNINGNSQTDHEKIDTKEGDDTVNITGTLNGTDVSTGNGDDIVKINNTIGNNARFFTGSFEEGSDRDIVEVNNSELTRVDYRGGVINTGHTGNDTINIKSSTIKGASSTFYISTGGTGMNNVTVDANSTLENVHIENQGGGTVDLSGNLKNVRVSVTNNDLYNNGTNHEYKSVVNIHNDMTGDSIGASSIMTGHGTDHINIDEGVTIDRVQFQMNAGDDTLDLKEGVTFKGGNIYLGSVDPSDTSFRLPGMPTPNLPAFTDNDTLNVKAGATLENSKISTQDGTDTINIEKGSTVNNNTIGMGKGIDTININENVSGMTVKMGEGEDKVNIGEGVKVKDSEFYGDSDWYYGSNNGWENPKGSKDKFNINKDAELENVTIYGDAKSDEYNTYPSYNRINEIVSGDDDINIGEGAKLKNVTIYGDSNFADPAMNNYSNIEIKGGNDNIKINKGANLDNVKIYGEVGHDTLTIEKGATVNYLNAYMDATLNGTRILPSNDIDDHITIQGTVKGYSNIFTGDGNDIVKVKQGGLVEDSYIQTQGGKDQIDIENGGKLKGSRITVGEGAVVTVQGTLDRSTIDAGNSTGSLEVKILNGANINVESYSSGVSKIIGGKNNDTVTMEGGTIAKGDIKLGKGDDIVSITGGEIKDNSAIEGGEGRDTITIGGNAKMIGGTLDTGAGLNDKILVKDGGELQDTEIKLGANGQNGGQSTDRALFEVTGSSELKDVQINAAESSGEQRINFYNDKVAEVKSLTGSNQKDIIDINGKVKFNSEIQTRDGDDELILRNGAVLENGFKADMGSGTDTLKIMDDSASLDFSKTNISSLEKIELGDATKNVTLSAKNILDITKGEASANHILDILGDSNDKVNLKGSGFTQLADYTDGGKVWHQYSATNTDNTLNGISHTVTIRIEDGVTVDI